MQTQPSFNPHPSRRTGATIVFAAANAQRTAVSILTRPEGRVQLPPGEPACYQIEFQSSPVPKDGCN